MSNKELSIIGELMNNSYARARNAFAEKNPRGYQLLALKQTELKADFLTLNIDGTQQIQVKMEEMLAFLPDLIPAIQEVTSVPLSFDNPSIEYHKVALKHYDRSKSDRPILNSLAASRTDLDEMIGLVKEYDTNAIVMASEHFVDGGSGQCLSAADAYTVTKYFVERLITEAGRTPQQIIIDPGLAPVGADTYGLVNIGLDTMKRIREDKDLKDVHIMVSLSNFAWGTPKYIKHKLERAYLTLGIRNGLDFALANPEKNPSRWMRIIRLSLLCRKLCNKAELSMMKARRQLDSDKPKLYLICAVRQKRMRKMTFTSTIIPSVSGKKSAWLKVGTLLDGLSPPLRNAHIVYNADKILYCGREDPPAHLIKKDNNKPDLVLANATLLPGLIDAHAHLFLEGGAMDFAARKAHLEKSSEELLEKALDRLARLLKCGIIAVRDARDKNGVGLALSRLSEMGNNPLLPYLNSPGAAIYHKGFYGSFMADPLVDHATLKGAVISRINGGSDRIKIIPTGIINFKKGSVTQKPQMTPCEIKTLVNASRDLGKQTFAHASGDKGIENALEARVDSIEHGFFVRDDQLSKMRDWNIAWVPTFTPVQLQLEYKEMMGWDMTVVSNLQQILDNHSASLLKAQQMGVKIIAGSDAGSYGVIHGWGLLYELELMEKAGLSALSVINSATGVSSDRLAYKENFGQIKAGYKARFILTENDPLQCVSNLRKDKLIVFDGEVHAGPEYLDFTGM